MSHRQQLRTGLTPPPSRTFIRRWEKSGGSETANFQMFANELCDPARPVAEPDPVAGTQVEYNDCVFERRVNFKHDDGSTTARRRIDLYKRDCFVMEAKQSAKRVKAKQADPLQPDLIPEDATQVKAGTATRGTGSLGQGDARRQATGRGLRPRATEGARLAAFHPRRRCRPRDRGLMPTSPARGKTTPNSRIGTAIPSPWKGSA